MEDSEAYIFTRHGAIINASDIKRECDAYKREKARKETDMLDKQDVSQIVLEQAARIIKGERVEQYGQAEDSFELIGEFWNSYIVNKIKKLQAQGINGEQVDYSNLIDRHDVAMMMTLLKVARTLGGKTKMDNYTDICGYAALAARM